MPLPWPRDVADIQALDGLVRRLAAAPVRVLAVVPDAVPAGDDIALTVWRRTATNRLVGTDHRLPKRRIVDLADTLLDDPDGITAMAHAEAPDEVLLCTHGGRDVCCGGSGTALHRQVEARWAGVPVRRCSHTGGHRYAPTGITLPDGRAWAFLDAEVLDRIVRREDDVRSLRTHQRGSSSLEPWAQVVERAVFEEAGWRWLDRDLKEVRTTHRDDGVEVLLRWQKPGGSRQATGTVRVARSLPVPDCGAPLDAATKASPELELVALSIGPQPVG